MPDKRRLTARISLGVGDAKLSDAREGEAEDDRMALVKHQCGASINWGRVSIFAAPQGCYPFLYRLSLGMKKQTNTILVIEDDPNDRELIIRAFRSVGVKDPIHALRDGAEAIAYLNGEGIYADRNRYEFPSTILTDLKMPRLTGFEVLQHLKSDPEWAVIPTIVLSASADFDDIKTAYLLGAASYFVKPHGYDALRALVRRLYDYWAEAEVPEINSAGKMLRTESHGKLGKGFR